MADAAPVVLVGGGGHARVVLDLLRLSGRQVVGVVSRERTADLPADVPWLGDDSWLETVNPSEVELANGIGAVRPGGPRREVFETLSPRGFRFASLIHPSAILAGDAVLAMGVQVFAGVVVQPGCHIGLNVLLNTRSVVDHDCHLEHCVHVATGAILCGGVRVGTGSHIGAGATVIQEIAIGRGVLVGAGAVVRFNVPDGVIALGVPARW